MIASTDINCQAARAAHTQALDGHLGILRPRTSSVSQLWKFQTWKASINPTDN